jgi:integrase
MPIWIVKNTKCWKVYQVTNTGQRITKGTFPLSKKSLANNLKKELLINEVVKGGANTRIEFTKAFDEYLIVLQREVDENIITRATFKGYQAHINNHIRPHIKTGKGKDIKDIKYLDEYTLADFNEYFLVELPKSKSKASNSNGNTVIQFKTYKDVIATFKKCIKFWDSREYNLGKLPEVLKHTIRKGVKYNNQVVIREEFSTTREDIFKLTQVEQSAEYKLMYHLAYVSGARPEEINAACFEDFDYEKDVWNIKHTTDNDNIFLENRTKTAKGRRAVEITSELKKHIQLWKTLNINPKKECNGKYTRLFKPVKNSIQRHVQNTATLNGISWKGGLSPFRKLSSTLVYLSGKFNLKEFLDRFGWEELPVFLKHYLVNINKSSQTKNIKDIYEFELIKEIALITGDVNAKNDKTVAR